MNKKKDLLLELLERENKFLVEQQVGSEEYNSSLQRVMTIEKQISESPRRDKLYRILDVIKVGSSVALPIIGLVCITATEKNSTFTGTLKDYTKLFIPKLKN